MGAPSTAPTPRSPRQAATWERKDEYFTERDERDATARECKHCDSLAAERRKRGAGRRRVELGLPAGEVLPPGGGSPERAARVPPPPQHHWRAFAPPLGGGPC